MFLLIQRSSALTFIGKNVTSALNITEDNVGRHILYTDGATGVSRYNDVFLKCSIKIENCSFLECDAFETSMASGYGGVIYGEECQLSAENMTAYNCTALYGGVISMTRTLMLIRNSDFSDNKAFRVGGAIFYRGDTADSAVQIYNTQFARNAASDLAGAMTIYGIGSSYFENVSFKGNHASIAGGAIDHVDNDMQFFECNFIDNYLDTNEHTINESYSIIKGPSSRSNARGGSSIFFINTKDEKPVTVFMQGCYFGNNKVNQAYVDKREGSTVNGYNLVFSGSFSWTAMFCGGTDSYASIKCPAQTCHDNFTFQKLEYANDGEKFNYTENNYSTVSISLIEATKDATSGTDLVPSPSKYTYRQTPLTMLPLATTRSFKNPPAISFNKYATLPSGSLPPQTTAMPTPPTQSKRGNYISYSYTQSQITIATQTNSSIIESSSIVQTVIDGSITASITYFYSYSMIDTYTLSYTNALIEIEIEDSKGEGSTIDNQKLIIIVIASAFALLVFAITGVCIYKAKTKEEKSSDSEETGNRKPIKQGLIPSSSDDDENLEIGPYGNL